MADKCPIAFAFGRYPTSEAVVLIAFSILSTPLIQGKWRIGYHIVELHQAVIFNQQRTVQSVAPFNSGTVPRCCHWIPVQKEQNYGCPLLLLPESKAHRNPKPGRRCGRPVWGRPAWQHRSLMFGTNLFREYALSEIPVILSFHNCLILRTLSF